MSPLVFSQPLCVAFFLFNVIISVPALFVINFCFPSIIFLSPEFIFLTGRMTSRSSFGRRAPSARAIHYILSSRDCSRTVRSSSYSRTAFFNSSRPLNFMSVSPIFATEPLSARNEYHAPLCFILPHNMPMSM